MGKAYTRMGLINGDLSRSLKRRRRSDRHAEPATGIATAPIQDRPPSPGSEPALPLFNFNDSSRAWRANKTDWHTRGEFEYKKYSDSRTALVMDPASGYFYWAEVRPKGCQGGGRMVWLPPFHRHPPLKGPLTILEPEAVEQGLLRPHPSTDLHNGDPVEYVRTKRRAIGKRRHCKAAGSELEVVVPLERGIARCNSCTFPTENCKCVPEHTEEPCSLDIKSLQSTESATTLTSLESVELLVRPRVSTLCKSCHTGRESVLTRESREELGSEHSWAPGAPPEVSTA